MGELQLYRLGGRVRFHCVVCRRDKNQSLVATTNGDWAQTVCGSCYSKLARAKREDAKKDAEANKVKHRLPGIGGLLAFFRAAGVDAELVSGLCLRINGSQTHSLAHLPPPETLEWQTIVDEIALKFVGGKFIKAMEDNARFGDGLRALLRQHEKGFAIMHGDVRLAIIHATRAQIPHHEVIYANFLMPGPHWQKVADVLHAAEAELMAESKREQEAKAAGEAAAAMAEAERRRTAMQRRIDQLPHDLAPELIDACLVASRRIRLERQVAYDRPVVLECDVGALTLLPITGTESRLLMPFRLDRETETLKAKLVLGDHDPLPLLIGEDIAREDAITAWTCALLGFADATCIELESAERRESARPRLPPLSASHHHLSTRPLSQTRHWPGHLKPVGLWTRYNGSFVAGHRRRLHDGWTASEEARDRARQVGIALHPDETWVQPHTRGIPDDIEMRFLWHAPAEFRLFRK